MSILTRHSEDSTFDPQAARFWRVGITDNDGDSHLYTFAALSAWDVVRHIDGVMLRDGNFYGHNSRDAVTVEVAELIGKPEGDDFYTISGQVAL
jgi:hypothetical protein